MSDERDWSTPCHTYSLRIAAKSWRQIDRACTRSDTIETGGILVGHYSVDQTTAFVTEALPPPCDSAGGRTWFRRGVTGLRELLTNRWNSRMRTYYVGEWHYHPANIVEPSGTDLSQMYAINADPRYHCQEPVMIIVGKPANDKRPVRAFVFPRGVPFMEFQESCRNDAS